MTDAPSNGRPKGAAKRRDPRALLRFTQELSWLLTTYKDLDFRELSDLTEDLLANARLSHSVHLRSFRRPPTIQLLVGVLPNLLTDEKLFPTNEDIVEFSRAALGIVVPRWQKISKIEIIGHIVCSADSANPQGIARLVEALDGMIDDERDVRKKLRESRNSGMSWNEVIQRLLHGE